jgi:hypothetical protein
MEQVRLYEFTTGAETSTQPDPGTPAASYDLITLGYLQSEYIAKATLTGSYSSPSAIVAGTGVAFTGGGRLQVWFIQGSGGAVDISANPQIAAGTEVGQILVLIGTSDTNTVKLEHGTGIQQNGECFLGAGSSIGYIWTGATGTWVELFRNSI